MSCLPEQDWLCVRLLDDLKVLVVLTRGPVATPLEACFGEQFEAEILVVNLIREVPRAVAVRRTGSGLDKHCDVIKSLDVGIVKRIDVNGQAAGMLREIG